MLDVGCGTGVPAIAAARCGAQRVTAVDLDPRAVAVAARNTVGNRVARSSRPAC
ncbi:MAG: 50S ribosomal protein L11 methyltransferase [Acidimicrobiales bacterium]